MPMVPFFSAFPDLAVTETRCLTPLGNPDLPEDEYGLIESYCDERGCDCRRVFINVVLRSAPEQVLATISYGWENEQFYRRWFPGADAFDIEELKGPCLARLAPQSRYAPPLLELVRYVLADDDYVDRIRRHYEMFKSAVDEHGPSRKAREWVPRNSPCPCGSGRKYKNCCG